MPSYADRRAAGQTLVEPLRRVVPPALLVLGLPRGGVVVAAGVARELGTELDALVVRKVALPGRQELAVGAVTAHSTTRNARLLRQLGVDAATFERLADEQRAEVRRREGSLRPGRPPLELTGRAVLLVDDGLATGATAQAAVQHVQAQQPRWLGLAVPVAPDDLAATFTGLDAYVCPLQPHDFRAVSRYYRDFDQTTDDEVRLLLGQCT